MRARRVQRANHARERSANPSPAYLPLTVFGRELGVLNRVKPPSLSVAKGVTRQPLIRIIVTRTNDSAKPTSVSASSPSASN